MFIYSVIIVTMNITPNKYNIKLIYVGFVAFCGICSGSMGAYNNYTTQKEHFIKIDYYAILCNFVVRMIYGASIAGLWPLGIFLVWKYG